MNGCMSSGMPQVQSVAVDRALELLYLSLCDAGLEQAAEQ
jgi:hypothetical protein